MKFLSNLYGQKTRRIPMRLEKRFFPKLEISTNPVLKRFEVIFFRKTSHSAEKLKNAFCKIIEQTLINPRGLQDNQRLPWKLGNGFGQQKTSQKKQKLRDIFSENFKKFG